MTKTHNEMQAIGEEIDMSIYNIRQARGAGNELADIMTRVDMLNGMVEEGLLDEDLYKRYALSQKKEVKNLIARVYAGLGLEHVEGMLDSVFIKEK